VEQTVVELILIAALELLAVTEALMAVAQAQLATEMVWVAVVLFV
jgi:hypothetical protein